MRKASLEANGDERLYLYLQSQREAAQNRERNQSIASEEEAADPDMEPFEATTEE